MAFDPTSYKLHKREVMAAELIRTRKLTLENVKYCSWSVLAKMCHTEEQLVEMADKLRIFHQTWKSSLTLNQREKIEQRAADLMKIKQEFKRMRKSAPDADCDTIFRIKTYFTNGVMFTLHM